jgi:pantetheine-phosphate adenylyltransferase
MHRVGVYPGSFDPPTLGHLDLIQRAAHLVDTLVVGIGVNSAKGNFLPAEDRLAALRECTSHLPNVQVEMFSGLLVHYAGNKGANVIFRGLRAVSDYDYEFRIAMANRSLNPEIETALIIAKDEYSFLASSVVREVALLGGDYRQFVPEPVAKLIARQLASPN